MESDIRDVRTSERVLRLTTNEGDGHIAVIDADRGVIDYEIMHGAIKYQTGQRLAFDILGRSKSTGKLHMVMTGTVTMNKDVTTPE